MGLFKEKKVVDWTERLNKQQQQIKEIREEQQENTQTESEITPFSFFDNPQTQSFAQASSPANDQSEEKRKRLTKALSDLTTRLEDLSNKLYKIEQRLELLERKNNLY